MPVFRVQKKTSEDLGFAISCLFSGAISREEFNQWVYWVIETSEAELPGFFFELDEFGPYLKDIYAAVGFVPSSTLTTGQTTALEAIGYRRGTLPLDEGRVQIGERSSPEKAAGSLNAHPEIDERFRVAFPFLNPDRTQVPKTPTSE